MKRLHTYSPNLFPLFTLLTLTPALQASQALPRHDCQEQASSYSAASSGSTSSISSRLDAMAEALQAARQTLNQILSNSHKRHLDEESDQKSAVASQQEAAQRATSEEPETKRLKTETKNERELSAEELCDIGTDYGNANNFEQAFSFYEKAANAGYAKAQNNLAYCYIKNKGIPVNNELTEEKRFTKAFELLTSAATQGDAHAQFNLALQHEQDYQKISTIRNLSEELRLTKAFELYTSAAAKGHTGAQRMLGEMLLTNPYVRRNPVKALHLINQAADAGEPCAMATMYQLLHNGFGQAKDEKKATEYFEKLKKQLGSAEAARTTRDADTLWAKFLLAPVPVYCSGDDCPICTGVNPHFEKGDIIALLPCKHKFCQVCIDRWFREQTTQDLESTCPNCRETTLQQDIIQGHVA